MIVQRTALRAKPGHWNELVDVRIGCRRQVCYHGTWTRPGEPRSELSLPDELASQFDASRPFPVQIRQVLTEQSVGDRLFIDSILEGTGAQPSFYDGHKAQQVIDAAVASAGTGRRVSLADA